MTDWLFSPHAVTLPGWVWVLGLVGLGGLTLFLFAGLIVMAQAVAAFFLGGRN